jgi:hypothetical protein
MKLTFMKPFDNVSYINTDFTIKYKQIKAIIIVTRKAYLIYHLQCKRAEFR